MSNSDSDMIKSIVEVYWHIFNTFTLYQSLEPVVSITTRSSPELSSNDVPSFTLYRDPLYPKFRNPAIGPAALPPHTPERLQRAYLKWCLCDFALDVLMKPITEKLQAIGARVDWLVTEAYPLITFHFSHSEPEMFSHSVLSITSKAGDQYIADFTIEQFGYSPERWFMRQGEYLATCTTDGTWSLVCQGEEEWYGRGTIPNQDARSSRLGKWYTIMQEFVYCLDWDELEGMTREARLDTVVKRAQEVFKEAMLVMMQEKK